MHLYFRPFDQNAPNLHSCLYSSSFLLLHVVDSGYGVCLEDGRRFFAMVSVHLRIVRGSSLPPPDLDSR